jgi:hypothetical protein
MNNSKKWLFEQQVFALFILWLIFGFVSAIWKLGRIIAFIQLRDNISKIGLCLVAPSELSDKHIH